MSNPKASILVVDDNPGTRYSTSRVLRASGFNVLEAATGSEALSQASKHVPDLIVLDVNLPDLNGYEVCRQLRARPEMSRTPVLHLSASFISDVDKVHGFEAGADGYITHPVEPPVLIATVNAFLRARRAEDALRASEAKFKAVFDDAANGIALLDAKMTFLEVNTAVAAALGIRPEHLVGRNFAEFVGDSSFAVETIDADLAAEGVWRGTVRMHRPDGDAVELEWNVSLHSADGVRLAIATDVTERIRVARQIRELLASERSARADAERANRLKDDFLAALSHELRSPLNVISGWSQLLRRQPVVSDDDLRRGLEAIERSATVQMQLIEDLLDVARITAGKLRFDLEAFDPAALAMSAVENARVAARARDITLSLDLEHAGPVFVWDSARFQQVVWNLVDNAVKFTSRGGRVDVVLARGGEGLTLTVSDTGRGISPEFLPHVFDQFRQEDSGTNRQHGGLGLGLAIVKHVVEAHGGVIHVESAGEGQGSTFHVKFLADLARPEETPVRLTPLLEGLEEVSLADVRVLVVEDDSDARHLVSRVLRDAQADVCEAGDAAGALDAFVRFEPHVVVSDIGMPGVDGYELIAQIRSRSGPAAEVPAIALTAFVRETDRRRALRAGYNLHLAKPVDAAQLVGAVRRLMATPSE